MGISKIFFIFSLLLTSWSCNENSHQDKNDTARIENPQVSPKTEEVALPSYEPNISPVVGTINGEAISVSRPVIEVPIVVSPAMPIHSPLYPARLTGGGAHSKRNRPITYVTFGDSLSDPGNNFAIFGQVSLPPFQPLPDYPYDVNGHRFTNGPVWIELLAKDPKSKSPAYEKPGVFTNYAVGRARARAGSLEFPDYHLSEQVNQFLDVYNQRAFPDARYMIWIGANDIADAFLALEVDPMGTTSQAIIQQAIAAIVTNIQTLASKGARTFYVNNLPDLGKGPAIQFLGPPATDIVTQFSLTFNEGLAAAIAELNGALNPDAVIKLIDVLNLFGEIVNGGDLNSTDPCLTFFVVDNAFCNDPDSRVFWDGFHPTAEIHRRFAKFIEGQL